MMIIEKSKKLDTMTSPTRSNTVRLQGLGPSTSTTICDIAELSDYIWFTPCSTPIMPLFVNDAHCPRKMNVAKFMYSFPHFKESSKTFLEQEVKTVGPEKLLYIGQREVAATSPNDDTITFLGSEDATTCHIAVLRHSGSGATSLIHFDGCQIKEGLESMVNLVTDLSKGSPSGRLELHLFGGFLDDKKNSEELSDSILAALHKTKHDIYLSTACITHHNTVHRNSIPFPVIYGIAVNVKSGEMFHATFPDKGPDSSLRNARHFTGGKENLNIYDPVRKELVIPPFHYDRFERADQCLSLPDALIRKYMSTSPAQEKEGFADSVKASLRQLKYFPDPLKSVFTGGLPRRYTKDCTTGKWIKIDGE